MENGKLDWVARFDKMNKDTGGSTDEDVISTEVKGGKSAGGGGGKKRLSVERIYQKKTQLEHILLRPDTYIGSVEPVTQAMWVWDTETEHMIQRDITYVPGLYKIFDEILVNAADNKVRDPTGMTTIKIDLDTDNNKVRIWNNGKGIPVVEHQTEHMFVPTLIFGHLLTSSNYDDSQKKVTGGRNGYGAKLCNIFSSKFMVETSSKEYKKAFRQTWTDNMTQASEVKIIPSKEDDYTCVTFYPDLSKFKMDRLDNDIISLFTRRAFDTAGSTRGVKVFLNGKRLPIKNFKDYIDLYTKDKVDDNNSPLKVVHEAVNPRWEVALTLSDKGFQHVSFVNSIATTKGGRHVDYIADQVVSKLIEVVKKKEKKGVTIKPFQVKNHLWVFVNCLVENPAFDSQTKENMILQAKSFGSKCALSDKFINSASKCGVVEAIQSWMRFKQQNQLNKKMSGAKTCKLKGIPKLDDANEAGTRYSMECTLILTEGDSAKTLAVSGLAEIGRDKFGVFPLRGKFLNVREASHKQIMENAEVNNVIKILGLRYKEQYDSPESLKTLRYGKVMIMTDQDQDGSHIKGLLINFIHHNWPKLLKHNFIEEFITPIVKVHKQNQERAFYSLPEFEEWKAATANWHTWKIKYYKGLGTSTSKEAKEYFTDIRRHRIPFKYVGQEDDASIVLAFSKKKIEERKEWLTNFMEDRKRRLQLGLPELYLYGKETRHISYNEFVNRELILFSNMDNERSIPSLVDGLKPGQRKVLFTCFKRNLIKELKVAQLAASVAEQSAYHHGEQSLVGTIVVLAQNFVGSNNINLLQPIGQFGTRLQGGKDAASPRYIFTCMSVLTRHLFNVNDDPILKPMYDDNLRIEPEWYIPIIPTVLVNGAEGIGTGWSTRIQNYDVREICDNVERMIDGIDPLPMKPNFKNFRGSIENIEEQRYVIYGEVSVLDETSIEISELPVRTWTHNYKETVLEPMLVGTDKAPPCITDYKEYHTDTSVRFVVSMTAEKLRVAESSGLHKYFKLQTTVSTGSMVLFDASGCIRCYSSVDQILREFYVLRLEYYQRRKDYMEGMMAAEHLKMDNIARFICEKIDGKVVVENKEDDELTKMLVRRGYDSDPVKSWKTAQNKLQLLEEGTETEAVEESGGPDYNYLIDMPLRNLTKKKKEEILKNRDVKADQLYQLRQTTHKDLWRQDLANFRAELDKVEQKERDDLTGAKQLTKVKGRGGKVKALADTKPSELGVRVVPQIDEGMRSKAASQAAARKRKMAVKKEVLMDEDEEEEDSEVKPLAERIGMSPETVSKPPKKEKVVADKKPAAATKKPRVKKPSGSPKKKGKKRNPWSDEEEDEEEEKFSDSDEMNNSFDVEARERVPRRNAASKVQYKFNDEDSDEKFSSDDDVVPMTKRVVSEDSDDYQPSEPAASDTAWSQPVSTVTLSDDDDEEEEEIFPKASKPPLTLAQKKEPPAKKPTVKKTEAAGRKKKEPAQKSVAVRRKAAVSDSDGEVRPKKAAPAKRKKKTTTIIDSDLSEEEFSPPPKKSSTAAARKKKAVSDDDFDDDFPDLAPRAPRGGVARNKKVVKYNFDDDDSDDDMF